MPGDNYYEKIYHILCTCIYLYEYSYGYTGLSEMKKVSDTEYMNTIFLQCVSFCDTSNAFLL